MRYKANIHGSLNRQVGGKLAYIYELAAISGGQCSWKRTESENWVATLKKNTQG